MKIHASAPIALALALTLASAAAAQTNPDTSMKSNYGTPTPRTTSGAYNNTTTGTSSHMSSTSSTTSGGRLPKTASPMPLLTLLGSAATAAGYWLSQRRRPR